MPLTYALNLFEWNDKSLVRVAEPDPKLLEALRGVSTDLDEGFRTSSATSHTYNLQTVNTSTGQIFPQGHAVVESRDLFEYKWGYNHPAWRLHNLLHGMDVGGPWLKYDIDIVSGGADVTASWNQTPTVVQSYTGYLYPTLEVATLASRKPTTLSSDLIWIRGLSPIALSNNSMDQLGADAISYVQPTNPAADLSIALAELYRDGLPSMPGKAEGNVGSEYLNLQFAWSPTINDGLDFIKATRDFDSITNQFIRDSGRIIRRSFDYPITKSTVVTTTANVAAAPLTGGVAPTNQLVQVGTLTKTVTTETRKWFSGAFTYHLPSNLLLRNVMVLDRAYGVVPGPDTAWALLPYSWLFDWFSNAREVMQNFNAFTLGGLIMPWGYMMCDTTTTTLYRLDTNRRIGTPFVPLTLESRVITRTRQRRRANPFGFGIAWDGLNPFQLSILAALGISRGALPLG